jgi:DNA modification methylase
MTLNCQDVITYIKEFTLEGENINLFEDASSTEVEYVEINKMKIPRFVNEFWTSKQRQASSLHEVSYRACFKPQLPRFFINLLTKKGDKVYDPFSGRGTTVIEAGILGRNIVSNDINPLSQILTMPRFFVPNIKAVIERLDQIPYIKSARADLDLSMFYHPETEAEIVSLKNYLKQKSLKKQQDPFYIL